MGNQNFDNEQGKDKSRITLPPNYKYFLSRD
jgi:hypothetical protein